MVLCFFFLFHCRLFSASKSAHCQVSFHVIYNRLNSLTFMQSDTVRWWCCSSSVDKAPPPVLERHLTYFPLPSTYTWLFDISIVFTHADSSQGLFLGCGSPRKLLINDCERFLLAVLSQRLSLVASVAAPAVYTWTQPCWLSETAYSGPHGLTHLSDSLPPSAYQQFSDFCAWQLNKSSCQHFYFSYLLFTPSLLPPLLVLQLHEVLSHAYRFYLRFVFTVLMDKASFQSASGIKR